MHGLDHWGRYLDEFAPVDGKWLITHRREITDAAFAGGWGARRRRRRGASSTSPDRCRSDPVRPVHAAGSLRNMAADRRPDRRPARRRRGAARRAARRSSWRRPRRRRDAAHGARITFSPKVFIPLTMLCRDKCGYCTFAKPPAHLMSPYLELDDVLAIARRGAALGCHEALFTLGEAPEARYPDAAAWLAARGYSSTVDYLGCGRGRGARRDRPAPPRQRRRAHRGPSCSGCGRCRRRRG